MLYSNKKLTAEERTFDFGSIYQVSMGEKGRGRKLMTLTCPENTIVNEGMNEMLSLGLTKSGKARINDGANNSALYMLLSTEGPYIRGAIGNVSTNKADAVKVLASGWGAFGEAGRTGSWDVFALEITDPVTDIWIRVKPSRGNPYFFHSVNGKVEKFLSFDDVRNWADVQDIELTIGEKFEEGWTRLKAE